ncbi:MAG: alginate export family protein, partial [Vitreimonas sp.]
MLELRIGSTLLLAIITTTQAQERPTFAALRYDENWSALCATPAKDFWEPVKCVRMSDEVGHYASFGGELRERVEALDAIDFGRAAASTDAYALHCFLLHADFHFGDSLRIFTQLGSHFESGRNGGPSPADKDEADLQQAFIDVSTALGDGRATLRVGRQELTLGSSRIVSVRESPNVRRAFDGLRAFWQLKSLRIDTFYLRPVQIEPGALDDGANSNERFWGAQASGRLPLAPGGQADLYYLGYERDQARFAAGTGHELRHSIGVRLHGKRAALDWNTEALWQFGRFGGERIRAWTIASDTGYT